ncbi:LacI family DNA-binding transcriptional regulator [Bombiscardovia coagulans]|uniref:Sucrose operon repressor n=1 Tax=Bombiscardovia coagulans TaxID=686666 RepID=A0A261ETV9_9BIFI|nr:LacI family DNA-binding transcriptional regulator [Bombiscardovia coagulans]OZG50293.1 sucrose operon repressor [Bombiscardovia coagulans]
MTTIRQIAEMSGVSIATVSRIINGKGGASDATIKKVQKVVNDLGYEPNFVAKTLSEQSSDVIAVLVPNLTNPFFAELVEHIEQAAQAQGYRVYLCDSEDDRSRVEYYLKFMEGIRVRGAIINSLFVSEEDLNRLHQLGITTLTIDRAQFSHPYSAMAVNHRSGSYKATAYLIEHGNCDRLIFVSGPEQDKSSSDRYAGYLQAVTEHNATAVAKVNASFSVADGYKVVSAYLVEHKDVNGIVCADDAIALGALRACADLGLRVPEDVRIIGYDNIQLSQYCVPRLSTVNQLPEDIGSIILDLFQETVDAGGAPIKKVIEPHLVIRETSQARSVEGV